MSDLVINICPIDDTLTGNNNNKKKQKFYHKKMRYLEAKGYLRGKQNNTHHRADYRHHQSQRQNGSFTKYPFSAAPNKHSPHLTSAAGASHCSSRPSTSTNSQPSVSVTVNSNGRQEQPKEPVTAAADHRPSASGSHRPATTTAGNPNKFLSIDCEMVGSGPKGSINQLARCSIVSYEGDVVYDKFIKPSMPVTDYRTRWSGIRPRDLIKATPYSEARKEILKLLMGKVVIGHAIHNDYKALGYSHPSVLTRDTSRIPLLNLKAGFAESECASLKRLTKAIFNRDIQTGRKGHSSVEDAKATMELYKVVEVEWERTLVSKSMAS
ncbi:interferon-stimulated 20 kDa exonuclease-like 2 isoform 1-T4 [Odontesthes bonariensis]|uniref:interferon-stimulated 20 kDa exonuclease-like 2 n=1 Tax=Odontesthes bonariensis TaxID=219752 RepID=UPI003F587A91